MKTPLLAVFVLAAALALSSQAVLADNLCMYASGASATSQSFSQEPAYATGPPSIGQTTCSAWPGNYLAWSPVNWNVKSNLTLTYPVPVNATNFTIHGAYDICYDQMWLRNSATGQTQPVGSTSACTPTISVTPGFIADSVVLETCGWNWGTTDAVQLCGAGNSSLLNQTVNASIYAPVGVCNWQGCRAGAASIGIDDGYAACNDTLVNNGFRGTYYLSYTNTYTTGHPGADQDWSTFNAYFKQGHEIALHSRSEDAWCNWSAPVNASFVDADLTANANDVMSHINGTNSSNLISFTWPCGIVDPTKEAIASQHGIISARGYFINQSESPNPIDMMNLKDYDTPGYNDPPAPQPPDLSWAEDQAVKDGTWVNYVFHDSCVDNGSIAHLKTVDLWTAPQGNVSKYVLERENSTIANLTISSSSVAFTLLMPLNKALFDQPLSFRTLTTQNVTNVTVNGNAVKFNLSKGYTVFTFLPSGSDSVVVQLKTNSTANLSINATIANITNTSALASSTANVAANMTINYGNTALLGTFVSNATVNLTSTALLSNLSPNTTYFANVTRCDVNSNCKTLGLNFTTLATNTSTGVSNVSASATNATNASVLVSSTADVASNMTVNYGNTASLGSIAGNATVSLTVTTLLSGLSSNMTYFANVTRCDAGNNCKTVNVSFVTLPTNISIANVSAGVMNVTNGSVIVNSTANLPANMTVNYGNTTSLGTIVSNASVNLTLTTSLAGLSSNTTYFANVTRCDVNSNCITVNLSFITLPTNISITNVSAAVMNITNGSVVVNSTADIPANMTVNYGNTTSLGTIMNNATVNLTSTALLSGLSSNTTYFVNITRCDVNSNCKTTNLSFVTLPTNISISNVNASVANITNASVVINSTADIPANMTVNYGNTTSLGTIVSNATVNLTSTMLLTGLFANTTYFANITRCDAGSNCKTVNVSFMTLPTNISITNISVGVANITNGSAVVNSSADVPANMTVNYGNTTLLGTIVGNATVNLTSTALLTGLSSNTTYYVNITRCDVNSNCKTINSSFITLVTNISISNVGANVANITNVSAVVYSTADIPANMTVNYGNITNLGTIVANATVNLSSTALLPGLSPNTTYFVNVTRCDANSNCKTANVSFVTLPTNISIANVTAGVTNITNASALVNSAANVPANMTVNYGNTTSLGTIVSNTTVNVTSMILLLSLSSNTTYYANITRCDAGTNCKTVGFNFTTLPTNISIANVTASFPNITNASALVNSVADVPANLTVNYGTTALLGTVVSNVTVNLTLTAPLSGLVANTTYFANVTRCDVNSNCKTVNVSFITLPTNTSGITTMNAGVAGITNASALVNSSADVPANMTVNYGTTAGLGTMVINATLSQNLTALLLGLVSNTTYFANVTRCDAGNNCKTGGLNFTTLTTNISILSNVFTSIANVTNASAVVNSNANVAANMTVNYGTSVGLGTIVSNPVFSQNLSALMSGLVSNTTYLANVTRCDAGSNCQTTNLSFVTLPTNTTIVVNVSANIVNITNVSAIVSSSASVAANMTVNYGTTASLGTIVASGVFSQNWATQLSSLLPNTTYFANVTRCDVNSNCGTANASFITLATNTTNANVTLCQYASSASATSSNNGSEPIYATGPPDANNANNCTIWSGQHKSWNPTNWNVWANITLSYNQSVNPTNLTIFGDYDICYDQMWLRNSTTGQMQLIFRGFDKACTTVMPANATFPADQIVLETCGWSWSSTDAVQFCGTH